MVIGRRLLSSSNHLKIRDDLPLGGTRPLASLTGGCGRLRTQRSRSKAEVGRAMHFVAVALPFAIVAGAVQAACLDPSGGDALHRLRYRAGGPAPAGRCAGDRRHGSDDGEALSATRTS